MERKKTARQPTAKSLAGDAGRRCGQPSCAASRANPAEVLRQG